MVICFRVLIFVFYELFFNLLVCNGGNEKMLIVELLLRIFFKILRVEIVFFMYKFFMYLILDKFLGSLRRLELLVFDVVGFDLFFLRFRFLLDGKRWFSIVLYFLINVLSRLVVKKGFCRIFWMNGSWIRVLVFLLYFLRILVNFIKMKRI